MTSPPDQDCEYEYDDEDLSATDRAELEQLLKRKMRGIPNGHVPSITLDDILPPSPEILHLPNIPPDLQLPYLFRHRVAIARYENKPAKNNRPLEQDKDITRAIWFYRFDTSHQFARHHDVVRWNIALFTALLAWDEKTRLPSVSLDQQSSREERGIPWRRQRMGRERVPEREREREKGNGRKGDEWRRQNKREQRHESERMEKSKRLNYDDERSGNGRMQRSERSERNGREYRAHPYARPEPQQRQRQRQRKERQRYDEFEGASKDVAITTAAKEFMQSYLRAVYEHHNPTRASSSTPSSPLSMEPVPTILPYRSRSDSFSHQSDSVTPPPSSSLTSLTSNSPQSPASISPMNTVTTQTTNLFSARESFIALWTSSPQDLFTSFSAAQRKLLKNEMKRFGREWDDLLRIEEGRGLDRFVGSLIPGTPLPAGTESRVREVEKEVLKAREERGAMETTYTQDWSTGSDMDDRNDPKVQNEIVRSQRRDLLDALRVPLLPHIDVNERTGGRSGMERGGEEEGVTVVDVRFAISVLKGMGARDMVGVLLDLIGEVNEAQE